MKKYRTCDDDDEIRDAARQVSSSIRIFWILALMFVVLAIGVPCIFGLLKFRN
jgi:hypothetical protein